MTKIETSDLRGSSGEESHLSKNYRSGLVEAMVATANLIGLRSKERLPGGNGMHLI